VPQLIRVARTLHDLGCETVSCALRADLAPRLDGLRAAHGGLSWLDCVPVRTPSSLHTLALGLRSLPGGAVLCSMVDTVMRAEDWRRVRDESERALRGGADAAIAVTPDTGTETALYAAIDGSGRVLALRDDPPAPLVTGGIYAFDDATRDLAGEAVGEGLHRMRAFLRRLLEHGRRVDAIRVERIIDLDRGADLGEADRLIGAAGRG
jgi:hypothetical protein